MGKVQIDYDYTRHKKPNAIVSFTNLGIKMFSPIQWSKYPSFLLDNFVSLPEKMRVSSDSGINRSVDLENIK